jgi:hypothetical protein
MVAECLVKSMVDLPEALAIWLSRSTCDDVTHGKEAKQSVPYRTPGFSEAEG